jgi:hypothetical protein
VPVRPVWLFGDDLVDFAIKVGPYLLLGKAR